MNAEAFYFTPEGKPRMAPSFVCHADMLGFRQRCREKFKAGEADAFLQEIYEVFSWEQLRLRHALAADGLAWDRFTMKVFTDNVIIGYPVGGDEIDPRRGEVEWGQILPIFADFQWRLATAGTEGFLLRGGIAFGNHFMDPNIVFGEALLDAHEMDRTGEPPRIVLHSSAERRIIEINSARGESAFARFKSGLLRDSDGDGKFFIDYLGWAFSLKFPISKLPLPSLDRHRKLIVEGLQRHKGDSKILRKYEWAARYHNAFCRDFAKHPPVPPNSTAGNPHLRLACAEAQRLQEYRIDIEELAAIPDEQGGNISRTGDAFVEP
jgi:hypothetical protein